MLALLYKETNICQSCNPVLYGSICGRATSERSGPYPSNGVANADRRIKSVNLFVENCSNKLKYTEAYRSGHNGPHSKCGCRVTDTWVRIPPLPPYRTDKTTLLRCKLVSPFFVAH